MSPWRFPWPWQEAERRVKEKDPNPTPAEPATLNLDPDNDFIYDDNDPYVGFQTVDPFESDSETENCLGYKKRDKMPIDQRNYFRVYNEQLRRSRGATQFIPEIGVGPSFFREERETQVCCCGLQCALVWTACIDFVGRISNKINS
jgi:hypothetical protein